MDSTGSSLRGIEALVSDARAQVSQVKLIINDSLESVSLARHSGLCITSKEEFDSITENLQTALSLLTDLDDR